MNRATVLAGIIAAAMMLPSPAPAAETRLEYAGSANQWWWWWFKKPRETITEIVLESGGDFDNDNGDFDILLTAVLAAGLEGALADPHADLTVFAPNDKAFVRLAQDLGYEGSDEAGAFQQIFDTLVALGGDEDGAIAILTEILLYHVSGESQFLLEVIFSGGIDTLLVDMATGDPATILPVGRRLIDAEPELSDAFVSLRNSNIRARNGVIHTISRVMFPVDLDNSPADLPTLTGLVAASGGEGMFDYNGNDYDILLNAVLTAGLAEALNNPDDALTVLAPNDFAFLRTARDLGYRGHREDEAFLYIAGVLEQLGDPIDLLTAILTYHVVPEQIVIKDLLQADSIATLQGAEIRPNSRRLSLKDQDRSFRDPRVVINATDLRASNGFAQTINRVLFPVDVETLVGEGGHMQAVPGEKGKGKNDD